MSQYQRLPGLVYTEPDSYYDGVEFPYGGVKNWRTMVLVGQQRFSLQFLSPDFHTGNLRGQVITAAWFKTPSLFQNCVGQTVTGVQMVQVYEQSNDAYNRGYEQRYWDIADEFSLPDSLLDRDCYLFGKASSIGLIPGINIIGQPVLLNEPKMFDGVVCTIEDEGNGPDYCPKGHKTVSTLYVVCLDGRFPLSCLREVLRTGDLTGQVLWESDFLPDSSFSGYQHLYSRQRIVGIQLVHTYKKIAN